MEFVKVMAYINLKTGVIMKENSKTIYMKAKEKLFTNKEHGMKETLKLVKIMDGAYINIKKENIMKDNGKTVNVGEKVNFSLITVISMKVILSMGNSKATGS